MRRRTFVRGCCAGIAAMCGARIESLSFGSTARGGDGRDVIVSIFLRGGMDSLSFLVPYADAIYTQKRTRLALTAGQVLQLTAPQTSAFGEQMGLHPAAAPLVDLLAMNDLAIVGACGSPSATRSHFEAQDYMERGKPDDDTVTSGWLGRYLEAVSNGSIFSGMTQGSAVDVSLEGFGGALALNGADGFSIRGTSTHRDDLRRALRLMYRSDTALRDVATRTLDATDYIDFANPGTYTPGNGVVYPDTNLADALASIAQIIRLDIGLQAASVNMGGWDTHENQAGGDNATGTFANNIGELTGAMRAFWDDLVEYRGRVTVMVMSEFGRRLKENDNRGTDHGHGGMMMVLSGAVDLGKVYGAWPGLDADQGQLFQGNDLDVTTDFRTVLAEVLQKRLLYSGVGEIFPEFVDPGPLGIFGVTPNPDALNGVLTK